MYFHGTLRSDGMKMRRIVGMMVSVAAAVAFAVVSSPAMAATGLVGNWHFDEGSGTVALDSSGNNNDGRLINGAGWAPGRFGSALSLTTTTSAVQVPTSATLEPATAVSVGVWVKRVGSPGTFRYVVAKGAAGCLAASYAIYSGASGGLFFYVSSAPGVFTLSPDAGTRAWDGNWHFVMGTYDEHTVRLYVDGVQIGNGTPDTAPIPYALPNSNDLFFGDYPGCATMPFFYNGLIDEGTVWNRALSAAEVASLVPTSPTTTAPPGTTPPGTTGPGTSPGTTTPTPGATAPVISNLKISPKAVSARKLRSHKTVPTISYTDSEAATSFFTLLVSRQGVVKSGRCQLNGKAKRGSKHCRLWIARAGFRHADNAGANRLKLPSARGALAKGSYEIEATPIFGGVSGNTLTITFKIT
jgi:hypothetical protein